MQPGSTRLWSLFTTILPFVIPVVQSASTAKILIYSATADFRHDSIPTAIQALQSRGASVNIQFDNTEDKSQFTDQILAQYDALLFLDNTGEVLDKAGKEAFQRYLNLGGNFVAIHSASDCLRNTTFYGREVECETTAELFKTVDVIDSSHPSTSMLPAQWHVQDEMYNFKSDPRAVGAIVVLSADESSYVDNGTHMNQGSPHPTAWFQERGAGVDSNETAGRSFYTSLGHLNETWQDDLFLAHVLGGITWTLQSNTTLAFNSSAVVGNPNTPNSTSSSSSSSTTSSSTASSPSSSRAFSMSVDACIVLVGTALAISLPLFLVSGLL